MIRVILDNLPDPLPAGVIGNNTVLVNGVEKPALYFRDEDLDIAQALGGEILQTLPEGNADK